MLMALPTCSIMIYQTNLKVMFTESEGLHVLERVVSHTHFATTQKVVILSEFNNSLVKKFLFRVNTLSTSLAPSQNLGKSQVRSKTSQVRRNGHGIRIKIANHEETPTVIPALKREGMAMVATEEGINLADKATPVPVVIETILKGN
mgnify:CR=1 FL=1